MPVLPSPPSLSFVSSIRPRPTHPSIHLIHPVSFFSRLLSISCPPQDSPSTIPNRSLFLPLLLTFNLLAPLPSLSFVAHSQNRVQRIATSSSSSSFFTFRPHSHFVHLFSIKSGPTHLVHNSVTPSISIRFHFLHFTHQAD